VAPKVKLLPDSSVQTFDVFYEVFTSQDNTWHTVMATFPGALVITENLLPLTSFVG